MEDKINLNNFNNNDIQQDSNFKLTLKYNSSEDLIVFS